MKKEAFFSYFSPSQLLEEIEKDEKKHKKYQQYQGNKSPSKESSYLAAFHFLTLYMEVKKEQHKFACLTKDAAQLAQKAFSLPPFIFGVTGSVAVGKTSFSKMLAQYLSGLFPQKKILILSTDGFLWPSDYLKQHALLQRKGFPESYDITSLLHCLAKVKLQQGKNFAPLYSHEIYDIIPDKKMCLDGVDILIVEGINILQYYPDNTSKALSFISDFIDATLYLEAEEGDIKNWYLQRFKHLRQAAENNENCYFHRYALMAEEEALSIAEDLWQNINLKNFCENIAPYKNRAQFIVGKRKNHQLRYLAVRKF